MFLIRLTASMRETVGAGDHRTAAAMVKAEDALWDARGGHDPTVAAASTQRSRSPAPNSGKRGDKRGGNARPKSRPPSRPDFHSFQNPGNGVCKFHNYYANRANRCISPCSWLQHRNKEGQPELFLQHRNKEGQPELVLQHRNKEDHQNREQNTKIRRPIRTGLEHRNK